ARAEEIEYGAPVTAQSALNLVYLLGFSGPGQLRLFGPSNEKYHVRGGNDQIASRLAAAVSGSIHYGYVLTGSRPIWDGSYLLTFRNGTQTQQVPADRVVLALPFSILR